MSFAKVFGVHTADSMQYDLLKENAKNNRKNPTEAESVLWDMLKGNNLGYHFRRQHIILDYIVDFICLDKGLVIELDGGYHNDPEQKEYDAQRTAHLQRLGYTELRFKNEELLCDPVSVIDKITETLNTLPSLQGRVGDRQSLPSGRAGVGLLYGNMIKEYPDGRRVKDTCGGGDYTPKSFLYFYKGTLNHDCAYIRRDLFEKYGLYNEQMKICSDWEWYVRAIVLGGEKTVYTNIDVTVFDMMGVSESNGKNRELIQKERLEYLESIIPQTILHDYEIYSLPIVQYQRLKKYHLWGLVHIMERVLFKLEKWGILKR
jgi:very-short-patch-repair endonuclease